MNVIIVGCGKVGFTLADALSSEGHSVCAIDESDEPAQRFSALDVSFIRGNGSSLRVLRDAGVEDCDILIAVTSRDEVNMLCCLLAKKAGNCRTIARVRDPEYYQEIDFIRDALGIAMTINPELTAANHIYHLIRFPSAVELTTFARNRVYMFTLEVPEHSGWNGKSMVDISRENGSTALIAMVERNQHVIIPNGATVLRSGDRISLVAPTDMMGDIFRRVGVETRHVKKVMIIGGGTTSYYLARRLIQARIQVTIIELNRSRCETLSELLPRANVVWGNGANEELLQEEGLKTADAVVAMTNYDEENIMLALYTTRNTRAKVITKVNKTNFNSVISEVPVGSVVSPKDLTAESILRFARSQRPSPESEVEAVHMLAEGRVEVLAFRIKNKSAVTERTLAELTLRPGVLIAAVVRKKKIIIPSGRDCLLPDDFVIVVTTIKGIDSIREILE